MSANVQLFSKSNNNNSNQWDDSALIDAWVGNLSNTNNNQVPFTRLKAADEDSSDEEDFDEEEEEEEESSTTQDGSEQQEKKKKQTTTTTTTTAKKNNNEDAAVNNNNNDDDEPRMPQIPEWAQNDPKLKTALKTFFLSGYWTGFASGLSRQ
jgi:hypothetical protein